MRIKTNIHSEIGKLEGVILHEPGPEVENMTPDNAERALYSDILNLRVASNEYIQLKEVLNKVCKTFEVKNLLTDIFEDERIKTSLLERIFKTEGITEELPGFSGLLNPVLATLLIEGIILEKNNLTKYLNAERFLLRPLHNLFFTRDASMAMNDKIFIGRMASSVRDRESVIMDAIFRNHPFFNTTVLNPLENEKVPIDPKLTIEGGDFLVARNDVLVIGIGARTSSQGVDFIIEQLKADKAKTTHIIVQELPSKPESFIHLDMVFTFLDHDKCMVYEPLIFGMSRYRTIHLVVAGGEVTSISEEKNLPEALKKLGIGLKPIACGGRDDLWIQEREQWHSGANFFAFAPGKLIGYERNVHTIEELNKNGFDVINARDILSGKIHPDAYKKCVVTIEGSELARGGGGARCMTMPFCRSEI